VIKIIRLIFRERLDPRRYFPADRIAEKYFDAILNPGILRDTEPALESLYTNAIEEYDI
jgi:hypothetical protein